MSERRFCTVYIPSGHRYIGAKRLDVTSGDIMSFSAGVPHEQDRGAQGSNIMLVFCHLSPVDTKKKKKFFYLRMNC